jgi:hypothetical protein
MPWPCTCTRTYKGSQDTSYLLPGKEQMTQHYKAAPGRQGIHVSSKTERKLNEEHGGMLTYGYDNR